MMANKVIYIGASEKIVLVQDKEYGFLISLKDFSKLTNYGQQNISRICDNPRHFVIIDSKKVYTAKAVYDWISSGNDTYSVQSSIARKKVMDFMKDGMLFPENIENEKAKGLNGDLIDLVMQIQDNDLRVKIYEKIKQL
jgi:hypothetical protein